VKGLEERLATLDLLDAVRNIEVAICSVDL